MQYLDYPNKPYNNYIIYKLSYLRTDSKSSSNGSGINGCAVVRIKSANCLEEIKIDEFFCKVKKITVLVTNC